MLPPRETMCVQIVTGFLRRKFATEDFCLSQLPVIGKRHFGYGIV